MIFNLADCKVGEKVLLEKVLDEQLVIQLHSMGCVLGEVITIERKAMFGDPIVISIDDSFISLRKSDARKIEVKLV